MKKFIENKKLMIIAGYVLLGIITICCIINTVISNKKLANAVNENSNNNVDQKENEIKGSAEISNFSFSTTDTIFENGTSEFVTTIKNVGTVSSYINEFAIVVSNQNGEEIVRVYGIVDKELAPNEEVIINSSYGGDLSNYGKLDYTIEK